MPGAPERPCPSRSRSDRDLCRREIRAGRGREGARFAGYAGRRHGIASLPNSALHRCAAGCRRKGYRVSQIIAGCPLRDEPACRLLRFAITARLAGFSATTSAIWCRAWRMMFTPGRRSGWFGHGSRHGDLQGHGFPPTPSVRDAAKGVRLMAVPAGDFGMDGWHHAIMAVMRGVEDGFRSGAGCQ